METRTAWVLRCLPAQATALLVLVFLASCGGGSSADGDVAGAGGEGALRFRKLEVFDPAAGVNAFTMLIPSGWQAEGGIVWRPHLSNQAAASMRIRNPAGNEVLELMPCDPFTWRRGGVPFFRTGSIYLGNEVCPPVTDVADYVLRFVIPRYRKEITAPQVISRTPLPAVASAVAAARAEPGVRKEGKAERVRIAYQAGGVAMQEDFYCVLLFASPMPTPGVVFWGPDSIYSFRAEAGELDKSEAVLQAMATSVRLTPEWFNTFAQVQQMWIRNQMQAIRAAGRIGDYISRTSREISDTMMQAYENRQASMDRINTKFSEYIRGVESYNDPFKSAPVELPSGYGNAWVTPGGEYVLSENPNFNPNVGDNRNWSRMAPAR